ncbi:MAG: LytTR family DNA-binding domain-containing protein [Lachnospiraceae bacterium]
MKLILEDSNEPEITVTVKGNLTDTQVQNIVSLLKASNISNKIIVYDDEKEILTNIHEVQYFIVENRKVYAVISKKRYLVRYNLNEASSLFRNQGIVQIGKSLLVNTHKVQYLEAEFSGNYVLTLDDKTKLIISRLYMKEFRKAIMEA